MGKDWWMKVRDSRELQDWFFYFLCGAYATVSIAALIQLIRIHLRVPEYGWTTQKIFHLMNVVANGVRAIVFGFHVQVLTLTPKVLIVALLDLPGVLYFSTYTLLVLFYAELFHQTSHLPTNMLRIYYFAVNTGAYVIQICVWILIWLNYNKFAEVFRKDFATVVSITAALGFAMYGGGLFKILEKFPPEFRGRTEKLNQVGSVTAICITYFVVRAAVEDLGSTNAKESLRIFDDPFLNLGYYTLAELLPSALVLFILRKLPTKRLPA